ncbi:hypothetical protein PhCBS80983_g03983 [Powellomyces hirtus]|uniref:EF-hand domain-containing protein n=1 Tax=Powellomyces hirtus TaxID=109895 RepID=A0A507DZK1_9FUNG|nr:hypothetical protein PhCBS80983_g03983 [Powellomyces hirtus]
MPKVDLLTDLDDFTPAAESAFREIFARFDADGDGALSPAEVDAFAVAANGEKFDKATHAELVSSFETTAAGFLTLAGFLDMLHLQSLADPEETWKDLATLGYAEDLTLLVVNQ